MVSWVGASERAHRNARYAGGAYRGGISVGWLTTDQAASGHERTPSVPPTGLADGFGREDWPYHRHACGFTPVGHGSPARTYDSAGPDRGPPSTVADARLPGGAAPPGVGGAAQTRDGGDGPPSRASGSNARPVGAGGAAGGRP